jgi:lambda family phage holin
MNESPASVTKVIEWLSINSPMLYAAFLSCWIAFLRVMYNRGGWRQSILEAALCGAITAGAFPLLEYLGLPLNLAAALGAIIGTLGVKKIVSMAEQYADLKFPGRGQ